MPKWKSKRKVIRTGYYPVETCRNFLCLLKNCERKLIFAIVFFIGSFYAHGNYLQIFNQNSNASIKVWICGFKVFLLILFNKSKTFSFCSLVFLIGNEPWLIFSLVLCQDKCIYRKIKSQVIPLRNLIISSTSLLE